jgi:PAS domain S-box-containing protein
MGQSGTMVESNNEFRQIFHQLPDRKLIFRTDDPAFTIEEVTDSYAVMIGMDRKKLLGVPYFTAFPDVSEKFKKTGVSDLAEAFRKVIRTKQPQVQAVFRYDMPNRELKDDYIERYWRTTHYPIFGADGSVSHILQVSTNATNEVLYSRELKEAKVHLKEALEIGKVGSWTYDIENDIMHCDNMLARMFGMTIDEAKYGISLKAFFQFVHEDDRARVMKSFQEAIKSRNVYSEEYRTYSKGKMRWVIARGKVEIYNETPRFTGVAVDVTDQRNLQAQVDLAKQQDQLNRQQAQMLQARNEELQELSRTKDEFVALASHQLRTPATAVKQYVGMVLQGYVGEIDELQREMLAKAFDSNERQIEIINQILNAARADTGKLVMSPVEMDLRSLVRAITDEMRQNVESRQHTFSVKLPKEVVMVQGDTGYLRMAIENLINNANSYTPADGDITVELKIENHVAHLSVTDTGVGIKKSDQSKLFAKFSRIHNPLSIQAGGSGIGLYLAAEIVRLHHGEIKVQSKLHKGTTFTIVLPMTGIRTKLVGALS